MRYIINETKQITHSKKGSLINAYYSLTTQFSRFKDLELPTKFTNLSKNNSHYLSRYALSVLTEAQIDFRNIELLNFQKISQFPDDIFSLAHTSTNSRSKLTCAALALKASNEDFYGLGCDIEFQNRIIPKNSDKFFINKYDEYAGQLMELWCLKEACFKALSNAGRPIKFLKEVVLSKNSFRFINDKDFSKNNSFYLFKDDQFLFVLAFCAKLDQPINLKELK